jgi:hypothetical protein
VCVCVRARARIRIVRLFGDDDKKVLYCVYSQTKPIAYVTCQQIEERTSVGITSIQHIMSSPNKSNAYQTNNQHL